MIRLTPLYLFALLALPTPLLSETRMPLHDGWRVQSACKLQAEGSAIAAQDFPVAEWIETSVPSTVLAAQVADGVFPDPYFGDNLRKLPGASYPIGSGFANEPMPADSPYRCGWWYRTEFTAPQATIPDEHFWLHFGGINYRADVWLNGRKIAGAADVAGAYRTYDFDVTGAIEAGRKERACGGDVCARREGSGHQLGRLESRSAR